MCTANNSGIAWAIALHGGAGVIPKEGRTAASLQEYIKALEEALKCGTGVLSVGGSAMKAVEATVRYLEDHPFFNAGRGAVMNHDGKHELDASIMDGKNLKCGAVSGLTTVRNPISLARLVIEKTEHVLLSGAGAEAFATHLGPEVVPRVPNEWFTTPRRIEALAEAKKKAEANVPLTANDKRGTVGCVAKDIYGHVAAATSTGGMTNKRWGRVGDSPIIGAGTYADDRTCAVSCTGHGEHFIRHSVAHSVSAQMDFAGASLAAAAREMIHKRLTPGDGGLIAVDSSGNIVMEFNSLGMFRAAADSAGRKEVAIWEEKNLLTEDLSARTQDNSLAAP